MINLVIVVFSVVLVASSSPLSELGDFTTGGLSKLSYGTLTDVGGTTLVDLSNGINNVVCTKFGPNFLKILLKNHTCSSEAIAPTKCGTWPEFCKLYNNAPPCIQDCLSTSAIDIEMKLNGLVGGHERLGKCCCKRDLVQNSSNPQPEVVGDNHIFNNLNDAALTNYGLVGRLVQGVDEDSNDLLCNALGPSLLNSVFTDNHCPSGILLRKSFVSIQKFCAFYIPAPQCIKDCLTDAVIRAAIDVKGVIKYSAGFGRCCAKYQNNPPKQLPCKC